MIDKINEDLEIARLEALYNNVIDPCIEYNIKEEVIVNE